MTTTIFVAGVIAAAICSGITNPVESVETIIGRNETVVVVDTPQPDELRHRLMERNIRVEVIHGQLHIHSSTLTEVSQLAFEHRILIVEITEASKSLEETLLQMTSSSAEFASA